MKSKFLLLIALFATQALGAHTKARSIYVTDIVTKSGTSIFKLPTALPTASRVPVFNADVEIVSSSVTATELGYLSGVSSALQTQIAAKLGVQSGGVTSIKILTGTGALDFPSVAAGEIEVLTIAVTGAVAGDTVNLGAPAAVEAGLMFSGFVSAADVVTVRVYNSTGAPIDPALATWRAMVSHF